MTEPVELPGGTIMPIGHVASLNIQKALKASHGIDVGAEAIEQAIRDEIQMMSSHFTMAFAEMDAQAKHEINEMRAQAKRELAVVKNTIAGVVAAVAQNGWVIAGLAAAVFALGAVVGRAL